MKSKLTVVILTVVIAIAAAMAGCSHGQAKREVASPPPPMNWVFDAARYEFKDIIDADTGESIFHDYDGGATDDCTADFNNRHVITGDIVVEQHSDDTYIRSFRTIRIPGVTARMELKGVTLRCHAMKKNADLSIRNLSGKKLEAIFKSPYYGGKGQVGVGATIGVNLNTAILKNSEGVWVTNTEQMVSAPSLGASLAIGMQKLTFTNEKINLYEEKIEVSNFTEKSETVNKSNVSLKDALKIDL